MTHQAKSMLPPRSAEKAGHIISTVAVVAMLAYPIAIPMLSDMTAAVAMLSGWNFCGLYFPVAGVHLSDTRLIVGLLPRLSGHSFTKMLRVVSAKCLFCSCLVLSLE
jgi:hypothetical protein